MNAARAWLCRWLSAGTDRPDAADRELARLMNGYLAAIIPVLVFYSVWYVFVDWTAIAIMNAILLPSIVAVRYAITTGKDLRRWANFVPAVALAYFVFSPSITEQANNPSIWWLVFVPVLAANLLPLRTALWWSAAAIVGVVVVEMVWSLDLGAQWMAPTGPPVRFAMVLTLPALLLAFSFTARRAQDRQVAALRTAERTLRAEADELQLARDTALAASRTKREFLANTSHEVRTPLNGILGMVDLLTVDVEGTPNAGPVARIGTAGDALLATVDDILDCSKLQADKVDAESIRVEWSELAARALARSRARAAATGVRVQVDIDRAAGAPPLTDPTWLGRAIGALVDNAVAYSDGAAEPEVVLRLWRDGDRVVAEVRDNGPGFGGVDPASLIEAFAQGTPPPLAPQRGGIGLGLTIADAVARLLGGELSFPSDASEPGCVVRLVVCAPAAPSIALPDTGAGVLMPLVRRDAAPVVVEVTESLVGDFSGRPAAAPGEPAIGTRDTADTVAEPVGAVAGFGMRILLAEDNPVNVKVAVARLDALGCTVHVVGDGEAALDALAAERFDLVLMDVHMPVLDGCDATKRLRTRERDAGGIEHTIVVAMTAERDRAELERCRLAGMDDELSKPFRNEELAELLARWQPLETS